MRQPQHITEFWVSDVSPGIPHQSQMFHQGSHTRTNSATDMEALLTTQNKPFG